MKRRYLKHFVALTAALTLTGGLTGCSSGNSTSEEVATVAQTAVNSEALAATEPAMAATQSEDTLTVVLPAEPSALTGLAGANAATQIIIMESMTGTLLEYDDVTKTAVPSVASGYETIDDTHYRFTIREDAVFSDGTPVTAEDVVYCFGLYKESGIANAEYFNMDETEAIDDKTLVLALTQYVPGWEFMVAESSCAIFSKSSVEAAGGAEGTERTAAVSCGKYIFTDWKNGEYIMLERNENYWDQEYIGYYKNIKYIFIGDSASRLLAVKSGDADIAYKIANAEYFLLENDLVAQGICIPASVCINLFFNSESGPCADTKVREAIAYAVDSESVNAVINMGHGNVIQGLLPTTNKYYKEVYDGGTVPHNPEKAKDLLAEAGYADGLELKCIVLAANREIATIIQENLRQVGINMDIEVQEQSVYLQNARAGNYDCQVGNTTAGTVSPNNFNQIDPAKVGISVSSCRITDPVMSEMISRASSPSEGIAREAWSDILDYIFNGYYLVGLCDSDNYHATGRNMTGLISGTRMGYIDVSNVHPTN